ncbi:uncharacterized protein LOC116342536 [Contarinia nasturtii]|uniref:uncharacterized protein LOC116342536 n=1 Tax=Contarinia nasturtii TaxID=265458 RepID=UPI0012D3C307|nr:uncharacterized protein LOC116342536 [Contarinia nasturtii]
MAELCRKLYQSILKSVESNEDLQKYSVIFSTILTEKINRYERKFQALLNEAGVILQNKNLSNDDSELINKETLNCHDDGIEETVDGDKSFEQNLMTDYDKNVRNMVESIFQDTVKSKKMSNEMKNENNGEDLVIDAETDIESESDGSQVIDDNFVNQQTQHLMIEAVQQQLNFQQSSDPENGIGSSMNLVQRFEVRIEEKTIVTTTKTEERCDTSEEEIAVAESNNKKHKLLEQFDKKTKLKRRKSEHQFVSGINGMTSTPQAPVHEKAMKKRHSSARKTIDSQIELEKIRKTNQNKQPKNPDRNRRSSSDIEPSLKKDKTANPKASVYEKAMKKRQSNARKRIDGIKPSSVEGNGMNSTPQASVHEKAMKKRHSSARKTIESRSELEKCNKTASNTQARMSIGSLDKLQNQQKENKSKQLKNTDPKIYAKNSLHGKFCQLCNKNERYLVNHYMNQHPDSEVMISRPSPTMAKRLLSQKDTFSIDGMKILGFCFFCEEWKNMTRCKWAEHILTHTGEKLFRCSVCYFESKRKLEHKNCKSEPVNIYESNTSDSALMGFICKKCNYLQVKRERMVKHMVKQHKYPEVNEGVEYEKIMLIPDLKAVDSALQWSFHDYIAPAQIFKCAICFKKLQNAEAFEDHFDREHYQSFTHYKCVCGEMIFIEGLTLTGGFICAHLKMHSAKIDMYQCMMCDKEGEFDNKTDIEDHLLNDHADCQFKYRHFHRDPDTKETSITEMTTTKIVCEICSEDFKDARFAVAIDHFERNHPEEGINLYGSSTKKITQMAKKITTNRTSYCGAEYFTVRIN